MCWAMTTLVTAAAQVCCVLLEVDELAHHSSPSIQCLFISIGWQNPVCIMFFSTGNSQSLSARGWHIS